MEMRTLGRTGVKVSPLCLGAMMFGSNGNTDDAECIQTIHAALDGGINFVDTADVYSRGDSERVVGEALKGARRDNVVLATKFHGQMSDDPNHRGNSRRWIIQECENSLRRLQTDWIDLYQVHRPETPVTDIDETLGALTDLVRQGKVRYLGSSTFPAQDIVEAQWVAEKRGRERFVCEQPPYSIFVREIENAVLPTCERYGMGVIPWSPLDGGWLTGKYRQGEQPPEDSRFVKRGNWDTDNPVTKAKLDAVEELTKLAADAGTTMINLALAWTIRHPAVTSSIIGPKNLEQLESQIGAADLVLSDDVLDRIDEICPPGTNVGDVKHYYSSQWLAPWRRRRPAHKG
jgi:aryl-alcohol dehydrogenase-like predicted oxidoreductase